MKTNIWILLSLIFLTISCSSEKTVRYTIASQKADCTGVAPQKCMLIKKGNAPKWEYFFDSIEGFNYKEGYEYILEVKEVNSANVPADASSKRYILVKEVSKTVTTSENLPEQSVKTASQRYQFTGAVLAVDTEDIGKGGAAGKVAATVVKIRVTSSTNEEIKVGSIIHCELIANPKVDPLIDREYVFKAKYLHPAHAKGIYMLETDVMDLV